MGQAAVKEQQHRDHDTPLQALGLLGWWFYNSFTWVSNVDAEGVARPLADRVMEWLDPTTVFGLGTCLLQWGVVIAVLLFFNRRLAHVATAADGD